MHIFVVNACTVTFKQDTSNSSNDKLEIGRAVRNPTTIGEFVNNVLKGMGIQSGGKRSKMTPKKPLPNKVQPPKKTSKKKL
jgi:hypothetical protein